MDSSGTEQPRERDPKDTSLAQIRIVLTNACKFIQKNTYVFKSGRCALFWENKRSYRIVYQNRRKYVTEPK